MSQTGFPGIQPAMLEYFVGIALNNYRSISCPHIKTMSRTSKAALCAGGGACALCAEIDDDMEQLPRRIVSRIAGDNALYKGQIAPTAAICGCPFTR